jgi:hypothetical protein
VEKPAPPQVGLQEAVTAQNFQPDFRLTASPEGNKIQLQSFGGCDSVETDSPINITLVEQGERMLTRKGGHFYLGRQWSGPMAGRVAKPLRAPGLALVFGGAKFRA